MSCETLTNRIAHVAARTAAGISRLASKRSFYAGMAVGAAGAGALALAASRLRRRRPYRARPRPIPGLKPGQPPPGSRANPRKLNIPKKSGSPPAVGQTRLEPEPVTVQTKNGPFTVQEGYRVLHPDGRDTGLAITRAVIQMPEGVQPGQGWMITHLASGGAVEGPFDEVGQAQALVDKLTELDWTGERMSLESMARVVDIIKQHKREAIARAIDNIFEHKRSDGQ